MSDSKDTLNDLKKVVSAFCEERDWRPYHNLKDLAIGVSTEASELLDIFRFVNGEELRRITQDPEQREKIADELADVLHFLLRISELYDFDLSECVKRKVEKNARKYPAP